MSANFTYFVQDAIGDKFLFTVADENYADQFRKFAHGWIRHATRPGAHNDRNSAGKRINQPVKPCKIVILPSLDAS